MEFASNALLNKRHIRPSAPTLRRRLAQHIAGVKPTRSPTRPAQKDIRVRVQDIELGAHVRQARAVAGSAAGLGEHGLALVGAEVVAEGLEGGGVVGGAGGVGAAVV
jgi:hypothetical protein